MKPQPYFYFSTNLLAGHSWKFMLAQGIISILLGIIFALNFGSALLIFAILLGIMLLGCGVQGFALMALNRKFKIGYALYSLFWFIAGLFLVIDPLMGASFLMIVLGIWFVLHAIELFTAALRDYQKATLIGTTTFGKGTMQITRTLSDGSAVKLSTNYYNPPSGVNYDGVGVAPDIELEMPEELEKRYYQLTHEEDNQLQRALEWIRQQ